jgi:hypothetical protein
VKDLLMSIEDINTGESEIFVFQCELEMVTMKVSGRP